MCTSVQFSYCINNRQPNGSLSNVLSRLAVGVRVDGDGETQRKELELELELELEPPGETFPQFPQNRNRKSEKGVVRLRTIIAHCLAIRASCVLVRVCRVLKAHSVHKLGASQRQRCGSNAVRHPPSGSSPIKVYKQQDHQPHR